MYAAEHAPCDPFQILDRRHGLAEVVERGAKVTRLGKPDFFNSPKTRDANALQTPHQRKMILTNCAACAAPLAHNAPRCVRCWTRYCDATCQHDHWRRGHKQICKRI